MPSEIPILEQAKEKQPNKPRISALLKEVFVGTRNAFTERYIGLPYELYYKILISALAGTSLSAAVFFLSGFANTNANQSHDSGRRPQPSGIDTSPIPEEAPDALKFTIPEVNPDDLTSPSSKAVGQNKELALDDHGFSWETRTISITQEIPQATTIDFDTGVTIEELQKDYREVAINDYATLFFDSSDIPVAIQIMSTSNPLSTYVRRLSNEEIQAFKNSKSLAQDTKEPAVVSAPIADPFSIKTEWDMKNQMGIVTTEVAGVKLPDSVEVLTEEALATFGVRMLTDPRLSMEPGIRPEAFQKGGILQALEILNRSRSTEEKVTLDITLVNSAILHGFQLAPEQRAQLPQDVLSIYDNDPNLFLVRDFRTERLREYNTEISQNSTEYTQLQNEIAAITDDSSEASFKLKNRLAELAGRLIALKRELLIFTQLTDDEIFYYFKLQVLQKNTEDISFPLGSYYRSSSEPNKAYIFFATDGATRVEQYKFLFWYRADESLVTDRFNPLSLNGANTFGDTLPQVENSYPKSDDLNIHPNANHEEGSYHFDSNTWAETLAHELIHANFMEWIPMLAKLDVENGTNYLSEMKWFIDMAKTIPGLQYDPFSLNRNEFDTDIQTENLMDRAYKKLIETGDDSLYPFVFPVPPTLKDPFKRFMIAETTKHFSEILVKLNNLKIVI